MKWITEEKKKKAKRANLVQFLQKKHPDAIFEKHEGDYAFTKRTCITFFRGMDDYFRYCDHQKRLEGAEKATSDSIDFLREYLGYSYSEAVTALCDFEDGKD